MTRNKLGSAAALYSKSAKSFSRPYQQVMMRPMGHAVSADRQIIRLKRNLERLCRKSFGIGARPCDFEHPLRDFPMIGAARFDT